MSSMMPNKFLFLLLSYLILSSCGGGIVSGNVDRISGGFIDKMTDGSYTLKKWKDGPNFTVLGNMKTEMITEATNFCMNTLNAALQITSTTEAPYIHYSKVEIQFICVPRDSKSIKKSLVDSKKRRNAKEEEIKVEKIKHDKEESRLLALQAEANLKAERQKQHVHLDEFKTKCQEVYKVASKEFGDCVLLLNDLNEVK